MAVNNKIPTSCKTDLLTGQQSSIARYRTVDRWPYFHWFSKSRDIDFTISNLGLDGRRYLKQLMDIICEWKK